MIDFKFFLPSTLFFHTNGIDTSPPPVALLVTMDGLPAQPNRSVMEGLEVLLAAAREREPLRVRPLARKLGMTPTRVQRYLATLAHLGMMRRNSDRSYAVGPGIHALSAMSLSASGLAARAMRVLPPLGDLGVIIALGVLWRDTVSYLYFRPPGVAATESLGRTEDFPARESSIGLLLTAYGGSGDEGRSFRAGSQWPRPLMAKVRRDGHAVVPRPEGGLSLAVPVGTPPVAGLAVSGGIERGDVPHFLPRLRAAARELVELPVAERIL